MQEQVLPFDHDLIHDLSELRTDFLTSIFRFFSEAGNTEGYLLIIALLFTVFDKRLGVYTSLVALSTFVINHLLKISLKNPRPFVVSNEYLQEWGVSSQRATDLINEYSTPSGHAMTAAAVFTFLLLRIKSGYLRCLFLLMIFGIGVARPYLGVHFVEDILLGWFLGGLIAWIANRYIDWFWKKWLGLDISKQLLSIAFIVITSLMANNFIDPKSAAHYPQAFVSILGFLSGTLIAAAYEEKQIKFSMQESTFTKDVSRFILMIAVLSLTLIGLDRVFLLIAKDATLLGLQLRYLRYLLVSVSALLLAPWLFVKLGLSKRS